MKSHPIGAESPTGERQYQSPNTGEYVTDAQYITELVVSRKSKKDGITLTYKYWNDKDNKYAKYFRSQITGVHKLLKKYSVKAVLNSLNKIAWCNSVFPAFFTKEVQKQQAILDNISVGSPSVEIVPVENTGKIGRVSNKKSKLALLMESEHAADDSIPVEF